MLFKRPFPTGRFVLALIAGHLAMAYCFALVFFLLAGLANLIDPTLRPSSMPSLEAVLRGVLFTPLVAFALALPAALLLIPYSVVGAIVAWPLVGLRRATESSSLLIGGGVGLAMGAWMAWCENRNLGTVPFEVQNVLFPMVNGIVAGAVYGWIIWRVSIKPGPH